MNWMKEPVASYWYVIINGWDIRTINPEFLNKSSLQKHFVCRWLIRSTFPQERIMNSRKLVIPLHFISWKSSFLQVQPPPSETQTLNAWWWSDISRKCILPHMIGAVEARLFSLYWSIHTKDESKCESAFAFIFGVNWHWRCGVTALTSIFFS